MPTHTMADRPQPQHSQTNKSATAPDIPANLKYFDELPLSALVDSAVVRGLYSVTGEATLWKWEQAGRIPKSLMIAGSRRKYWRVKDLRAALAVVSQEVEHATS